MRSKIPIHVGSVFSRWTVTATNQDPTWADCTCSCGTVRRVRTGDLRSGRSTSCGCRRKEAVAEIKRKPPGEAFDGTPTYRTWVDMRRRCHQKHRPDYANYGGRGVTVCDRWRFGEGGLTGFECFLYDMGKRPEGKTLDRIDNDQPYAPGNCRWATTEEQGNNRRTNRIIEVQGRRLTVAQAAKEFGVKRASVYDRLNRGLSPQEAISL